MWRISFFGSLIICTIILATCSSCGSDPDSPNPPNPNPPTAPTPPKIPAFNADSAYNYIAKQVDFGPRVIGSEGHRACKDWLVETFRALGARVQQQEFTADLYTGESFRGTNIIAQINPDVSDRLLLCAHWDTRHVADSPLRTERQEEPILGADDFCANQKPASLRGTGTDYKAMIVDGTNRIACTNANCAGGGPHSSWIMRADTEYRRADDQTVFTTNSNAVFDFGAASLTAAFDTDATPLHWWTGLDQDWRTTVSGNTCVSWATNVGGFDGTYGSSAATDNNSISDVANSNFGDGCNTLNRLLCVEQ